MGTMIVLDTDVVSELMRPRPSQRLLRRLGQVAATDQATTAVTIGELAYGAERVGRPELYVRAIELLSDTLVLPFDRAAAERYGAIRSVLERDGRMLPDPDLRIAATALAGEATVVTGNVRHFARVPGLACEDWLRG